MHPCDPAFTNSDFIWALKDVSFEVNRGEVLGITCLRLPVRCTQTGRNRRARQVGRNGAGKSTVLKVLSRIAEPTEGRVEVRRRVGSLLEVGAGFHPELTGRENIFLNGAMLGMRKADIQRKFDEIVAFAEVQRFTDTPVKEIDRKFHDLVELPETMNFIYIEVKYN